MTLGGNFAVVHGCGHSASWRRDARNSRPGNGSRSVPCEEVPRKGPMTRARRPSSVASAFGRRGTARPGRKMMSGAIARDLLGRAPRVAPLGGEHVRPSGARDQIGDVGVAPAPHPRISSRSAPRSGTPRTAPAPRDARAGRSTRPRAPLASWITAEECRSASRRQSTRFGSVANTGSERERSRFGMPREVLLEVDVDQIGREARGSRPRPGFFVPPTRGSAEASGGKMQKSVTPTTCSRPRRGRRAFQ
jgi:hypothetical protein